MMLMVRACVCMYVCKREAEREYKYRKGIISSKYNNTLDIFVSLQIEDQLLWDFLDSDELIMNKSRGVDNTYCYRGGG